MCPLVQFLCFPETKNWKKLRHYFRMKDSHWGALEMSNPAKRNQKLRFISECGYVNVEKEGPRVKNGIIGNN